MAIYSNNISPVIPHIHSVFDSKTTRMSPLINLDVAKAPKFLGVDVVM